MNEHYIDSRFREELDGLEVNPPVEAWLAITDALDIQRQKHRKLLLFRTAATIAVMVVASFSFWFMALNETTPGNELQLSKALPNALQPADFSLLSASNTPFETINKKTTDHQHKLFNAPFGDEDFRALTQSGTSLAGIPSLEASSPALALIRPIAPAAAASYKNFIKTKHSNNEHPALVALATPRRNRNTTMSFGIHMAPQYNYRSLVNKSSSEYRDIPFQSLENQIFTYSAGLTAHLSISPRWAFQTGLNYNNMGQFVDGIVSYKHPERISLYSDNQYVITSLGGVRIHDAYHHFEDVHSYRVLNTRQTLDYSDVINLNKATEGITQTFSFIEVPLLVRYNIHRQYIGIDIKGGFAGSYLLRKDVFLGTDIFQNPIGETYGVKQFNFSVIGGLALNLPITGNIMLHIEPTAQLFLQPVVLDGLRLGNAVPYNFSLHTGFSYRF